MYDGAEHPDDMETALTEYEQAMFPRSAASAAAAPGLHEMPGDDARRELVSPTG